VARFVARTKSLVAKSASSQPKRVRKKRLGRPPAGDAGARVTDYPQLSVRLPAEVRDQLLLLSRLRGQPQWRLIVESVRCYLRDLSTEERRELEVMVSQHGRLLARSAK
jgi:hypothetical protein